VAIGKGFTDRRLMEDEVREVVAAGLTPSDFRGQRVIVLVPDHTRTAPIPLFFRILVDQLSGVAKQVDFMVALGTHPPMDDKQINRLFGLTPDERRHRFGQVGIYNHLWDDRDQLAQIGTIGEDEVESISRGLLRESVPVLISKRALEYDVILICGPTFPHEVVGFSGGNKYLFPGIAAPEIINFTHWLGALITNPVINGTKHTPVRAVIDRAAQMVPVMRRCLSLVVTHEGLRGLYAGTPEEAWSDAADLSSQVHIVWKEHAYQRVLSMAPPMYDDIWTAGKCMYKLEPVVADGGELIIYAPHVTEISYTHGKTLDRIGYHVRDYFAKQMEQFAGVPRGVMAHSTHVNGIGTWEKGVEDSRVNVVLATRIPEDRCRRVNLDYRNPGTVHPENWADREDEGVLLVPKAGEFLYRLKDGTIPRIPGDPVF
jgi:nickel-dependent lactate racemase